MSGNFAWNQAAAPAGAAPRRWPLPNPDAAPERMLMLWATPIGFVKAAMANNATVRGNTVSFTVGGKYKMEGTINAQGQVEKVRTWFDQPIVGDMLVETTYSGYKDFSGLQLPSRLVQTQDGYPALRHHDFSGHGEPRRGHRGAAERPRLPAAAGARRVAEARRRRLST